MKDNINPSLRAGRGNFTMDGGTLIWDIEWATIRFTNKNGYIYIQTQAGDLRDAAKFKNWETANAYLQGLISGRTLAACKPL